jgi:Domain of unknown function (DUF397)
MEDPAHLARHFDAALWRSSALCNNGACVEVAYSDGLVAIRDSKEPGPMLIFSPIEWRAFMDGVRHGEFDLPA